MEVKLKENEKFIFLVLDGIQTLYGANENGRQIIDEIALIEDSFEGCVFCVITGSSSKLRQLCFAKLPSNYKVDNQNYVGLDLNSTKFSAKWIYPFLEITDFEEIVKFFYVAWVDKAHISTTEELLVSISAFKSCTKIFNYRDISEQLNVNSKDLLPNIYNLSDSGLIRYIDKIDEPNQSFEKI